MTTKTQRADRLYGTFSIITLVSVYLLILVGGVVRSTGAGMGCPDWPKCFNQWVPPTSVDQLPEDYQEQYSEYRHEKNVRFAKYLRVLGMEDTAEALLNDESIREEGEFNAVKTWIEYVNRLLGALIGIFILLTFVFSIRFMKKDPVITYVALAALVMVIFQGWIGSIVVSTNLVPWMVTIHMLLALVIVGLLVFLAYRSRQRFTEPYHLKVTMRQPLQFYLVVAMGLMVIQIVLGTQVREQIDQLAATLGFNNREGWIAGLDMTFVVHRSISWLILFLNAYLFYLLFRQKVPLGIIRGVVLLILGSFLSGVLMAYAGVPAVAQPIHLLMGTGIIGLQYLLFLHIRGSKALEEEKL